MRRRIFAMAAALAAPFLLSVPVAAGGPVLAEGGGPAAPPAPPASPPAENPVELTIEEAFERLKKLRSSPAATPGAVALRDGRIRALGDAALALPAARTAAGEDLYRLGDLALAAGRHGEAAAALRSYLESPAPRPSDEDARAGLVRALARAGKTVESAAALDAYRKAWPKGKGNGAVTRALADALATAGDLDGALSRCREARAAAEAEGAVDADAVQSAVELLLALGRTADARKEIDSALALLGGPPDKTDAGAAARKRRLQAVERRVGMVGLPFVPPRVARWVGGTAPEPAAVRGKVVVYHFFAPWMETRLAELGALQAFSEKTAGKGLVAAVLAHTGGWRPGSSDPEPGRVNPRDEAADIERLLRDRGWKGLAGIAYGRESFDALGVRGLPMEVVVGRDGLVRFVRASGEVGQALTLRVAEKALAEPPPAPLPGAEGAGGEPPR